MASGEKTRVQNVEHALRVATAVEQKKRVVAVALEAVTAFVTASAAVRRQLYWHGLAGNMEAQTEIGVLMV